MSSSSSNSSGPVPGAFMALTLTAVGVLAYYNILRRQEKAASEAAAPATPTRQHSSNTFNSPTSSSAGLSRRSSLSRSSSAKVPKVTQHGRSTVSISALYVYPIRGCEGVSVDKADLVETGFKYDREWAVFLCPSKVPTQQQQPRQAVDAANESVSTTATSPPQSPAPFIPPNASFVQEIVGNETFRISTLTEVPRMRLITAEVDEAAGVLRLTRAVPLPPISDHHEDPTALQQLPITMTVPLTPPPAFDNASVDDSIEPFSPWSITEVSGEQVEGLVSPTLPFRIQNQGTEVGEWLSRILGRKVMLYRACAGSVRKPVLSYWDGNLATEHESVVFHDFASMTIISEEGIHYVRRGMREKCVPHSPFRPSIVVRGTRFPEEDRWSVLQLGGSTPGAVGGTLIKAVSWCPRTRTTNIEESGQFSVTRRIYNFLALTRQVALPNWKGKKESAAPRFAGVVEAPHFLLPASQTATTAGNGGELETHHKDVSPPTREAPMFGIRAFQQHNGRVQVGDVVWVLATHINLPDVKTKLAAMKC